MSLAAILPRMPPHPALSLQGNAPPATKARVLAWWDRYLAGPESGKFGGEVKRGVRLVSVSGWVEDGWEGWEVVAEVQVTDGECAYRFGQTVRERQENV
jgi:acyl-coenzyme A thioesterase 13